MGVDQESSGGVLPPSKQSKKNKTNTDSKRISVKVNKCSRADEQRIESARRKGKLDEDQKSSYEEPVERQKVKKPKIKVEENVSPSIVGEKQKDSSGQGKSNACVKSKKQKVSELKASVRQSESNCESTKHIQTPESTTTVTNQQRKKRNKNKKVSSGDFPDVQESGIASTKPVTKQEKQHKKGLQKHDDSPFPTKLESSGQNKKLNKSEEGTIEVKLSKSKKRKIRKKRALEAGVFPKSIQAKETESCGETSPVVASGGGLLDQQTSVSIFSAIDDILNKEDCSCDSSPIRQKQRASFLTYFKPAKKEKAEENICEKRAFEDGEEEACARSPLYNTPFQVDACVGGACSKEEVEDADQAQFGRRLRGGDRPSEDPSVACPRREENFADKFNLTNFLSHDNVEGLFRSALLNDITLSSRCSEKEVKNFFNTYGTFSEKNRTQFAEIEKLLLSNKIEDTVNFPLFENDNSVNEGVQEKASSPDSYMRSIRVEASGSISKLSDPQTSSQPFSGRTGISGGSGTGTRLSRPVGKCPNPENRVNSSQIQRENKASVSLAAGLSSNYLPRPEKSESKLLEIVENVLLSQPPKYTQEFSCSDPFNIESKDEVREKFLSSISGKSLTSSEDLSVVECKDGVRGKFVSGVNERHVQSDSVAVVSNQNLNTGCENIRSIDSEAHSPSGSCLSVQENVQTDFISKMQNDKTDKSKEAVKAAREAKKLAKLERKKKGGVATGTEEDVTQKKDGSGEGSKTTAGAPTPAPPAAAKPATPAPPAAATPASPSTSATSTTPSTSATPAAPAAKKEEGTAQRNDNLRKAEPVPPQAEGQPTKSKAELRAERRAKQEAQREAKKQQQQQQQPQQPQQKQQPQAQKQQSQSGVKSTQQTANQAALVPQVSTKANKVLKTPVLHKVKLFNHLYIKQEVSVPQNIVSTSHLHPAVIRLGVQYACKVVVGSNARCLALLSGLKQVIADYITPSEKEYSRGLQAEIQDCVAYLDTCRPISVTMRNALKHLTSRIRHLTNDISDSDAKKILLEAIDTYIREQIDVAGQAISNRAMKMISNGDVILTYGCSSLIQRILIKAHQSGKTFRVIIVDARPWREGKEMLRRLVQIGIPCTYVVITAASFIMREASKVFLGAHALLANGYVMSRAGTSEIALLANSFNVPILVCCETHKFSEKAHTDSIVYNELGAPDELATTDTCSRDDPLAKWKTLNHLTPLNITYDVTPPSLVSAVVTELSVLPCTSAPVVLRVKPSEVGH